MMGSLFMINVIVFFSFGAWTLWSFFEAVGVPKNLNDWLSTSLWFGTALILTAMGLWRRKVWARAAGIALCLWTMCTPAVIYLGPILPKGMGFVASLNVFRALPLNSPEWLSMESMIAFVLAAGSLRVYCSSTMHGSLAGKRVPAWLIGFFIALFAGVLCMDQFLASRRLAPNLKAKVAAKVPSIEARATALQPKAKMGPTSQTNLRVKACRISLDETRLLLVTNDGWGHIVDLQSGRFQSFRSRIDVREWPASFDHPVSNPIGPDADMYFDSDRNVILRFSDSSYRYGIGGGGNEFVSFTSSFNQIVVYDRTSLQLRRIEIPIGTTIWNLNLPGRAKNLKGPNFTSPDYSWMVATLGKNRLALVNLRDGRSLEITTEFDFVRTAEFNPKWVRLSGSRGNTELNLLFDLPAAMSHRAIQLPSEELAAYDNERGQYLTSAGQLKTLKGYARSLLAGKPLHAAALNPPRHAVAVEEGRSQLTLIDLDAKSAIGIGHIYDLNFYIDQVCFTVSSTRRVFAFAVGNQVEVFWSAHLSGDQFRSVVLTLPSK